MQILISGGGIGGIAAALAASRAGCDVRLFERTPAFSEVGAGIQLGPNVTRVLHGWDLADALAAVAAWPERLQVRSAVSSHLLGELRLGADMLARYGAPYLTLHRADLQALLFNALGQYHDAKWHLNRAVTAFSQTPQSVTVQIEGGTDVEGRNVEGDVLVASDGLWSCVRQQLLGDGPPRATGHLAYRGLVLQQDLPENLRSQNVTAWLGPNLHVVQYPVRGGEWLNVVAIVQGSLADDFENWEHKPDGTANAAALLKTTAGSCSALQNLLAAVHDWRLWALHDRPPMQGALQHALGRVALLGDAAHPMRPYLAQGAGMAIEDAAELGYVLKLARDPAFDGPTLLQRYALNRWQRNARVQARSMRNGNIFHASGPMRWGRDMAMKLLGEKLLDLPWLYGFRSKIA